MCHILSKGEIIAQGTYKDLQKEDIDFVSILTSEKGEDVDRRGSTISLQKVYKSAKLQYDGEYAALALLLNLHV